MKYKTFRGLLLAGGVVAVLGACGGLGFWCTSRPRTQSVQPKPVAERPAPVSLTAPPMTRTANSARFAPSWVKTRARPPRMRFSAFRDAGWNRSLADVEAEHVRRVLSAVDGNKTRAAEILGIDRKTLREKLRDPELPA